MISATDRLICQSPSGTHMCVFEHANVFTNRMIVKKCFHTIISDDDIDVASFCGIFFANGSSLSPFVCDAPDEYIFPLAQRYRCVTSVRRSVRWKIMQLNTHNIKHIK